MEPVVWKALPGAAGVVVWSGSDQLGTSVLHLLNLVIIMFIVMFIFLLTMLTNNAPILIISIVIVKRLTYLSPLQKHASAQRASIVLIWSLEISFLKAITNQIDLVPHNVFL